MGGMNRRRFLALSTGVVGASGLGLTAACAGDDTTGPGKPGGRTLKWWDHTSGNDELLKPVFDAYTKDSGVRVEYTYYQAAKMGQSLQLARTSNELPDVHTIAGLDLPLGQLVADGWFQPLQLSAEAKGKIAAEDLVAGVNVFDGEPYGFPTKGSRFFNAHLWYNKEIVAKAGLDPEKPPATFDEFRGACEKIKKLGTEVKGLVLNTGAVLGNIADNLAQSAGFQGADGTLFRTGEIQWHADPYVEACEFITSLYRDKYVMQGKFTSQTAAPRWMVGHAAYMIDGIWIPGTVKSQRPEFLDKVGSGAPLTSRPDQQGLMYRNTNPGQYFISKSSTMPKEASALIERLLRDDYQLAVARGMNQVPVNVDLLDDPEVHECFRQPVLLAQKRCFVAPRLARKDRELAEVMGRVPQVRPGMKDIIEGLIAGEVTDARTALKQLSDKSTAAREKTLSKAGRNASELAFPNWQPEQDYTDKMYGA